MESLVQRQTIQIAIHDKIHHNHDPSRMFITESELRAVWGDYHLSNIFPAQRWTIQEWRLIRVGYLKVLSILILIDWAPLVENFRSVFLRHGGRSDKDLPFSREKLSSFLGASALNFNERQYAFVPVVIRDVDKMYVHKLKPMERLPFVAEASGIGGGGFGDVTRVKIAPRYLLSRGSENPEVWNIARKAFT